MQGQSEFVLSHELVKKLRPLKIHSIREPVLEFL
jgi:hypothetical protein